MSRSASPRRDFLSPAERSERMSRIKHKDTEPEMTVRRLVHSLGYRYRLHRQDLPGTPDLVFASRRKVIFVHGCFWHLHEPCDHYRLPRSDQWMDKLRANKERDRRHRAALSRSGWDVHVTWECELSKKNLDHIADDLIAFLEA